MYFYQQAQDLDGQVQVLQKELKEKMLQLQQVELMCRRQKLELDNRAAKFGELDQLLVGLRKKFEESREENLQLTQILRTTKYVSVHLSNFKNSVCTCMSAFLI